MDEARPVDGTPTAVEWRLRPSGDVSPPVVRTLPYFELKLEHSGLDPSGHGGRFFPDAVPYELDGTPRVFYWRPALAPSATEPGSWELACATTHALSGFDSLPVDAPSLVAEEETWTSIIIEGTIGGDAMTSRVAGYSEPGVSLDTISNAELELTVDGTGYSIPSGERRRIRLAEQCVDPVDGGDRAATVTPDLVVRYPGQRELHHPAHGATYRLFPSFGLDLGELPQPLSVPTTADELDDAALARELGVDLSARPYPERVLWQAFAYTAFDPHTDATAELTQLETGHIVLRRRNGRL